MLYNDPSYKLLSRDCAEKQILQVVEDSTPEAVEALIIDKIDKDFDYGDFIFHIKGASGKDVALPFRKRNYFSLNDFWLFLEAVVLYDEPVIHYIFNNGPDIYIYAAAKKDDVRFVIMNTYKMNEKRKKDYLYKYSFAEAEVDLDIILPKKAFISEFYNQIFTLFASFESTAYFEPPITDFSFWIKDSEIIKNYLFPRRKRKKRLADNNVGD